MNKHIAEVFKKLRDDNDLTQAEFAEELGFSAGHIGSVEQGRSKPSYDLMEKIILKYDIDANLFFGKKRKTVHEETKKFVLSMVNEITRSYDHLNSEVYSLLQEPAIENERDDEQNE